MATLEQSAQGSDRAESTDGVRRRDFLNVAAVSFAGVGVVAVALPLVTQMNPPADVLALASTRSTSRRLLRVRRSRPCGASSRYSFAT